MGGETLFFNVLSLTGQDEALWCHPWDTGDFARDFKDAVRWLTGSRLRTAFPDLGRPVVGETEY